MDGIKTHAYDLVCSKATYSKLDNFYNLSVEDLTMDDKLKFTSVLILNSKEYANEATSFDNLLYDDMQFILGYFLEDSENKFRKEKFVNTWKFSIVLHFENTMQSLINDALEEYNHEQGIRKEVAA